jgi:hypothetical protein
MELTYLLTWIGAVGLVTLATYACFCLLKHGQRLEDVESERLWQYLLNPSGPESIHLVSERRAMLVPRVTQSKFDRVLS